MVLEYSLVISKSVKFPVNFRSSNYKLILWYSCNIFFIQSDMVFLMIGFKNEMITRSIEQTKNLAYLKLNHLITLKIKNDVFCTNFENNITLKNTKIVRHT